MTTFLLILAVLFAVSALIVIVAIRNAPLLDDQERPVNEELTMGSLRRLPVSDDKKLRFVVVGDGFRVALPLIRVEPVNTVRPDVPVGTGVIIPVQLS